MRILLNAALTTALLCAPAYGQSGNRFPAPLGLDRVLVGTVSTAKDAGQRQTHYILTADGNTYNLHGHEKELKRLRGKKVRITGNARGNEVTVNSVQRAD